MKEKGRARKGKTTNSIQLLSGLLAQNIDVWESEIRAKRCDEKHFENGNGSGNEEAEKLHGWFW